MPPRPTSLLLALTLAACSGGGKVAAEGQTPPPDPVPARTPAFLFWGQSNMEGNAALDHLPGILDPGSVDPNWIRFYQNHLLDFESTVGQVVPLDFLPHRFEGLLLTPYAMPVHLSTPSYSLPQRRFGLEMGTVFRLAELLGGPAVHIKLAIGGSTIGPRDVIAPDYPGDWFWVCAHRSWHPSLPKSSAPYTAVVVDGGTSAVVAGGTLVDPSKHWTPGEHSRRFVRSGGSFGLVLGNTADSLLVPIWLPPNPPPGPYVIEERTFFSASLLRTLVEDYVASAAASTAIDVRGVFIAIGESDSITQDAAIMAGSNLADCIDYMRAQLVRDGRTTLPADRLPVVVVQLKEAAVWPYAAIVNEGFRQVAATMPAVVAIEGTSYGYGGMTGDDRWHYDARGAVDLGRAMADAWAALR